MYQNDSIKALESIIAKTSTFSQLNDIIDYLTKLTLEADKDFITAAKKSVVQEEYRAEALMKNGIYLGYKDILERFNRILNTN